MNKNDKTTFHLLSIGKSSSCMNKDTQYLFLIFIFNWWLVYSIGLISVIQQHELTIGIHMSPPSWISLPPPAHSPLLGYYIKHVWVWVFTLNLRFSQYSSFVYLISSLVEIPTENLMYQYGKRHLCHWYGKYLNHARPVSPTSKKSMSLSFIVQFSKNKCPNQQHIKIR